MATASATFTLSQTVHGSINPSLLLQQLSAIAGWNSTQNYFQMTPPKLLIVYPVGQDAAVSSVVTNHDSTELSTTGTTIQADLTALNNYLAVAVPTTAQTQQAFATLVKLLNLIVLANITVQ